MMTSKPMTNMTPEQQQKCNLDCAEFCGIEVEEIKYKIAGQHRCYVVKGTQRVWNPYSDANDRNLVLAELLKKYIFTHGYDDIDKVYFCGKYTAKTLDAAQNACIQQVLIQWKLNK